MSDIPSEIYREILLRLPADSLFRFRSVCKAWRRLIDDSSFVKAHTNNQLSSNTLLIRNSTGAPLYLVNLESLEFIDDDCQLIDAIPVKQLIRPGVPRIRYLPTTSCNGLILISSDDVKKIWAIWNPLTRECHQLPQADGGISLVGTGLGYDYAADDYKVVRVDRFVRNVVIVYRTLVYSLKLASWRMTKDCPYDFWCLPEGFFLNGALHWESRDMIIVLDLGTEDYRQLPLPPIATEREFLSDVRLAAVGGCLTLSYSHYPMGRFYGWVMKDYGREWIKLFTLDIRFGDFAGTPRRIVAYLESKRQVLLQRDRGFLWIDVENNSVKQVTIHGLTRISSSQICPGSLYRLDDDGSVSGNVGGLKKRKRKRTRKRANTSLKFCVRDCDDWCCSDYSCRTSPSSSSCEGDE